MPTSASCRFEHMHTYCTVVRARNRHGGWSPRVASNGVRICLRPPAIGLVSDGADAAEPDGERDATDGRILELGWKDFEDECAGVV